MIISIHTGIYMYIGQQPKQIEQEGPVSLCLVNSSISPRPSPPVNELSKNPKNQLQELCQSLKFPLPKYQNQMSENGIVVTVSITIEGHDVCYPYMTSEQAAIPTKKHIKHCEEKAAEIAFKALSELYGTCTSTMPPHQIQSSDEQSGK